MIATIWAWLVSIFTKKRVGILFVLLFKTGASAVANYIADSDLQKKAYEFVKALAADKTLTNAQKAAKFNEQMLAYGKQIGKVFGESVINCLRELAVNALKAERGC